MIAIAMTEHAMSGNINQPPALINSSTLCTSVLLDRDHTGFTSITVCNEPQAVSWFRLPVIITCLAPPLAIELERAIAMNAYNHRTFGGCRADLRANRLIARDGFRVRIAVSVVVTGRYQRIIWRDRLHERWTRGLPMSLAGHKQNLGLQRIAMPAGECPLRRLIQFPGEQNSTDCRMNAQHAGTATLTRPQELKANSLPLNPFSRPAWLAVTQGRDRLTDSN